MKKLVHMLLIATCALALCQLGLYSQSKENGAIEGKAVMTEGEPLPGVEITLSSPNLIGGNRVSVTDAKGHYRFVALPPGTYVLEAKLEGFSVRRQEDVRLSVAMTLTVDFKMETGKVEEKIVVQGVAPLVDVKDSQTAVSVLTQEMIQNIPNTQFVSGIVNLAPGVHGDSAFGASDNGIQYQIDGVDTSDPELHTAYVFIDYGVVQEAKIMGVGAPAEYDGYSGIVFNTITKTGGNKFSGMFDSFVQTEDMNGKNSDNPDLTPPSAAYYNLHFDLGGPIVKDKLWFFGALQYYLRQDGIYGFTEKAPYYQPRSFFKLTWQPNRDNRFSFSYEGDLYTRKYRGASLYTDPIATRHQRSPELYFNGNYLHIFSDNTFLEAKGAGYISYYKLIPNAGYDLPGHYDYGTQRSTVNAQTYYHAFRDRLAVNVSVSHHADNFIKGSHDFKFGLDSELNPCRTEWGYAGKKAYNDYYGYPYYMYAYDGYVTRAKNFRASAYVQDSWSLSDRIKINPGIRANFYRGSITGVGTVFKPQIAIAPRLGITIDPFGDHRTAIKGHWGLFYDNILSYFYNEFAPKPDWISYYWGGSSWVENYRVVWDPTKYTMDPNLKMQYMSQWTIGIEREVLRDLSIGINYINRSNHNMIDRVALLDPATDFTVNTTTDPKTGQVITYYSQNNPGSEKYVVTNPVVGEMWDGSLLKMIPATPTRKYHGVEFVLTKRFSDKWMLNASYVYGKATGTNDNYYGSWGSSALGQSRLFVDPNYWTNNFGTSRLSYDPTHMLKVQGMVMLPLGINLSGYFSYISGYTYNRWYRVRPAQGTRYIPMELIGTLRYPAQTNLDLKVEKVIKFDKFRLGINADVYNVFNASTIDGINTTWSSSSYGTVTDLVYPRVFRLGLRLFF